jgi:hypothetical protein
MKKLLFVAVCAMALASARADTITLGVGAGGTVGDHILGEVIPSLSSSSGDNGLVARDLQMVNTLLGMGLGSRTANGVSPEYYRSTLNLGTLPPAVELGARSRSGEGITVAGTKATIILPGTFQYLIAAYDGPNGGAEIWYIGDLAAGTQISIPRYAYPMEPFPNGNDPTDPYPQNLVDGAASAQYGITSWTAFNPSDVPDGGLTALLLGLGVTGLGLISRRIRK